MSNNLVEVTPEYVYITIPAEYICVYHRILAMLADYGEEMLKDCKASCTDKNAGVIECFNMFNAAVAARKLGKDALANVLITYVKEKINMIYKGYDNSASFVFPIDENGQIKAFVSCGELPKFEINADDGDLYEHKFGKGFDEHFKLGPEDESPDGEVEPEPEEEEGLVIDFTPSYEEIEQETEEEQKWKPCWELEVRYDCTDVKQDCTISYYFDEHEIVDIESEELTADDVGTHNFKVVVIYNGITKLESKDLLFRTV